jgi:hypothetical protein
VFDLVYWGKGGFNWTDVYHMPIWLRKFYTKQIEKVLKKEKEAHEKAAKKSRGRRR